MFLFDMPGYNRILIRGWNEPALHFTLRGFHVKREMNDWRQTSHPWLFWHFPHVSCVHEEQLLSVIPSLTSSGLQRFLTFPCCPAHLLAHLLSLFLINHLVYIAVRPTLCLLDSPVWVHPLRHIAANELSLFLVLVLLSGSFVWFCLLSLPASLMSLSTLGFKMHWGDLDHKWKARHTVEYSFKTKTSEMHPWSDY